MTTLVLVRHGQTDSNINSRLHQLQDSATINSLGRDQMLKTAIKLKKFPRPVIYSSSEPRAVDSAQIISDQLSIPFRKVSNFHERDWGDYSNKTWPEVEAVLNPMTLEARFLFTPPGGESWQQAEARLTKALKCLLSKHQKSTVIIVTHGGSIRILMPFLLNAPLQETFKYDPDNASLTIFKYFSGRFTPVVINDTSHLST